MRPSSSTLTPRTPPQAIKTERETHPSWADQLAGRPGSAREQAALASQNRQRGQKEQKELVLFLPSLPFCFAFTFSENQPRRNEKHEERTERIDVSPFFRG